MIKNVLLVAAPSMPFHLQADSPRDQISETIPQPLGLCYLAAVLQQNGYSVDIYDPHIECLNTRTGHTDADEMRRQIIRRINDSSYDLLGISSFYIYTNQWSHFVAAVSKDKNSRVPVVIGGGYPSLLPQDALEDRNIDFVVTGEGESALLDLVRGWPFSSPPTIDGLAFRDHEQIFLQPRRNFISRLDELPFPAWEKANVQKHMQFSGKKSLCVMTSRGCPYSCTFCNSYESWGRKFRMRSAENVLAEVDHLINRFGVEDILFVDDNMTIDKKRTLDIAAGFKRRHITWRIVNTSSTHLDEETLTAMKESGCNQIAISVESAVPKTLKQLRKPIDLDKTREVVGLCRKLGILCRICYITGLPYDTKEDMLATFRYSDEVRGDWNQYSILVPYPGTDIYDYCKEHDYFIDPHLDLSHFTIRRGFLKTEHWDNDWVKNTTYDYNIRTNFLHNYNITEPDGNLEMAVELFQHVVKFNPKHIIALICLAYTYHRKGLQPQSQELLQKAAQLLHDPQVRDVYGKYLNLDETVVHFFNSWLSKQKDVHH